MENSTQDLIDLVIEQIKTDIRNEDFTAIDELLSFLPKKYLIGYLPEDLTEDSDTVIHLTKLEQLKNIIKLK